MSIQNHLLQPMLSDELFLEVIFLGGTGGPPEKKNFTRNFFQNFCFSYLGKVKKYGLPSNSIYRAVAFQKSVGSK